MTKLVYNGNNGDSIVRPSGYYGEGWASVAFNTPVFPEGLSYRDSSQPVPFPQQTFLGASIRSFSMNGGFGDSSSTLSVDLVVDEYNKSDNTSQGQGDDVYHSGNGDGFVPPIAGSPVFFKFGSALSTVDIAYRKTFYDTYGSGPQPTASDPKHIVFGGILQSYVQNRGPGGNPLYSVQVVDPREILSNVILILNNYSGSSFNTKNVYNIYGFLEHNMTQALSGILDDNFEGYNLLTKNVSSDGSFNFTGSRGVGLPLDCWIKQGGGFFGNSVSYFPVTGTGFSRRGQQGIPWYRVRQAIEALMAVGYNLPQEYKNKGFAPLTAANAIGSFINFRGYNYVVDFSGLPDMPNGYFLDFDQINLLDLALEICEVTSRDLFVSLLPIINHPACSFLYSNQGNSFNNLIAGIIRLDAIDRSIAPQYGAIKTYIDNLDTQGIFVESQDVGYELSNITTDKFVVGGQEVDMYYFSANADRDTTTALQQQTTTDNMNQWLLEKQLKQQILPYYGLLGNNAITIPKGWGAYQQILLDTTGLNAKGVGCYYVATEMELRCASISYECWKNFLQQYNDIYMESMEDDDSYEGAAMSQAPDIGGIPAPPNISNNYAVSVPRSVFETFASEPFGSDNLPKSACNPPYGYPLYYKRMTKLGIPEGGLTKLQSRITHMITLSATVRNADSETYNEIKNSQLEELENLQEEYGQMTAQEKAYYESIRDALSGDTPNIALLNDLDESLHTIGAVLPRLAKKGTENALKVYDFLKKVADENLGKKFLVKIPNKVNLSFNDRISGENQYDGGPFGFKPRPITSGIADEFDSTFTDQFTPNTDMIKMFLDSGIDSSQDNFVGALRGSYSPITEKHEFNYSPINLGGYFPFDLYTNTLSFEQISQLTGNAVPLGVLQQLIPQDLTNFLNENGRCSAYARFDHSQHLAFGGMNSEDFTQQIITAQGMIPDLCEFLDNVGEDKFESFEDADNQNLDNNPNQPKQSAFVKCTVEEKFFMPPKMLASGVDVYGQADSKDKLSRPRKVLVPCSGWTDNVPGTLPLVPGTGVMVDTYRYIEKHFYPTSSSTGSANRFVFDRRYEPFLDSYIIKTDIKELDNNNVYALITLPGKIIPTKDARYRDSVNQKHNTYSVKHYLTADVVKGLPEFGSPGYVSSLSSSNILQNDPACTTFSAEARSSAWLASKKAKSALQFGFPQQVQMSAPSPVYPDLVAIPLMSNERCYGPWLSAYVDSQSNAYINIGGRVEFIKDENLSPWNYAGYDLMNQAGTLQAQFANSLLLFSERGGFSFPGIPTNSLCSALLAGGPLVTNITVDVSDNGIRTTYKMDTYTAGFGKLQKQKQDLISKISRERQRLRDERNALIRKGIGKMQTSVNIVGAVNLAGNMGLGSMSLSNIPSQPMNHIVASVAQYETASYMPSMGGSSSSLFGEGSPGSATGVDTVPAASIQDEKTIFDTYAMMDNPESAALNAASSRIDELWTGFSWEPNHPTIANVKYTDMKANNRLYETEDFQINDDDVTLEG